VFENGGVVEDAGQGMGKVGSGWLTRPKIRLCARLSDLVDVPSQQGGQRCQPQYHRE
jgi:hypothetical protein